VNVVRVLRVVLIDVDMNIARILFVYLFVFSLCMHLAMLRSSEGQKVDKILSLSTSTTGRCQLITEVAWIGSL
jgi:uncharacterized membrane protein